MTSDGKLSLKAAHAPRNRLGLQRDATSGPTPTTRSALGLRKRRSSSKAALVQRPFHSIRQNSKLPIDRQLISKDRPVLDPVVGGGMD